MEPPWPKIWGRKKKGQANIWEAEHQHNPTGADTALGQRCTLNCLLRDLQAYFSMILNWVCVCFSPPKSNLHSPRERQCLVTRYKRKCISGWVEVGEIKNFKHSQEDSHIFNIGLNIFHIAAKISDIEIIHDKALAYGSSHTQDPVCYRMIFM